MRKVRDEAIAASHEMKEVSEERAFGSNMFDTGMSDEAMQLKRNYPDGRLDKALDEEIYLRLLRLNAMAAQVSRQKRLACGNDMICMQKLAPTPQNFFEDKLKKTLPGAKIVFVDHDKSGRMCLAFAAIKGPSSCVCVCV
jgi:hypothetical protein